jgi:hypothetical protein
VVFVLLFAVVKKANGETRIVDAVDGDGDGGDSSDLGFSLPLLSSTLARMALRR